MTMNADWTAELKQRLREFARERNWEQYHTPRNLAALISSEAGELLALFRWDQDAINDKRVHVEQELADVMLGVLRFADVAGVDLYSACLEKMAVNGHRYPVGITGPDHLPDAPATVVCGIDAGTFKSSSYVAWLRASEFLLTTYRADAESPLPESPPGWNRPDVYALDLPQGLARRGSKRRAADASACTPTGVLPGDRAELSDWRLYKGFIAAGLDTYWSIHSKGVGFIGGFQGNRGDMPLVVETYPRYVLKRLWPDFKIPSKRHTPEEYTRTVRAHLVSKGYRSNPKPTRPDHVDAMLCALSAQACLGKDGLPPGTVGAPPYIDEEERVVREGYIVAP
jgi:dCTP diphosphatase